MLGSVFLVLLTALAFSARAASFTPLGVGITVHNISADGSVVVGSVGTGGGAVRWTESGGVQGLGGSEALGASANGEVIVGSSYTCFGTCQSEAFRWTSAGMIGLGDLPGGPFSSHAHATSADGSVVVGQGSDTFQDDLAFRWTSESGMVPLDFGLASDVSADGSVVVGRRGGREAVRWTESGGVQGLGDLPGGDTFSAAFSVSADGSTVVGWSSSESSGSGAEAFIWTEHGGMERLGDLPGGPVNSLARDVSADGTRVVGSGCDESCLDLGTQAILWDSANGMRLLIDVLQNDYGLDLTGWRLYGAAAISDDGLRIAGNGINPAGRGEAWLAELPEPSSVTLLFLALVGLLCLRREATRQGTYH